MKLLLFASFEEAEATLEFLRAEKEENDVWRYSEGWIVVSGWGCEKAHKTALTYGPRVDVIWNLGIAGALVDTLALGTMHRISQVGKSKSPSLDLKGTKRLFTSDVPIHDSVSRQTLAKEWDLVDMEGYGVAQAARALEKECHLFKLVSDFAKKETRELILKNMRKNSEVLYESCLLA